ncbi:TPA: hypothetical protein ACV5JC_003995 [Escherichia coli]|nr:hypothetical protein [Escherichia coli]
MSEKWSKEFDSCFQVGSIEEIADALEKRSGSEENALAMLAMTAFTLMTRRGICEMQNVAPDGKGIRLELIGFRENETILLYTVHKTLSAYSLKRPQLF